MRKCGDCQLCCRLLPTEEIGKAAGGRCQYQRAGKGCSIHARKPASCSLWNCRWLVNDDTDDQLRPDRSHIVLDMMPDVVRITDEHGGNPEMVPVIVAWVDPDYPDAWKAPAFQRYLLRQEVPVLLRLNSSESIGTILPPKVTGQPRLFLKESKLGKDMPNTLEAKAKALGGVLELPPEDTIFQPATITMPDGKAITVATAWRSITTRENT
jgi:hypothetical protein